LDSLGSFQKTSNSNFTIFITLNTSIFTKKVMIYSMFISEVNNMRSFILRAIMTSLGKNNIWCLFLKSILTFFKKKKLMWFRWFATTFYHWNWHYSILYLRYYLVFPFITYLFLLKDHLRNENNTLLRFYFFHGFSTHFTTIISKAYTLSNEKNLTKGI
jgi:hypothetical protein